jgi:hypothetical protein
VDAGVNRTWAARLGIRDRRWALPLAVYVACTGAVALIFLPVALERSVETVRFSDRLGTFPVEVSLCHNGRSTLDTGLLGQVFWARTGSHGFGAYARATGPPEAGGTLASYIDPAFIEANVALINDPDPVVTAYSRKFQDRLRARVLGEEIPAALIGGTALFLLIPRRRWRQAPVGRELGLALLLLTAATGISGAAARLLFDRWDCSEPVSQEYALSDGSRLSFASPETREVAVQVRPFIIKNLERSRERASAYESAASSSFAAALSAHDADLAPRDGERIVLAEADPQGSLVGVRVRTELYAQLLHRLGRDAFAFRTIAGDVTSNGTVAEAGYVTAESTVAPGLPVVAVGGDHDSAATRQQLEDNGALLPDPDSVEVAGLLVSGADDHEHKTLFGGIITNESGVTETELGEGLRTEIDERDVRPGIVLLHQPAAAAGYLGLVDVTSPGVGSATVPFDDGIPDLPPGTVDMGHRHEQQVPWVIWNTGGSEVTWTVVDQLGTAGGAENSPTFNRFSTPTSPPLKPLMVRLQYFDTDSGLQTGYATLICDVEGLCTLSDRVEVGLPLR